MTLFFPFWFPFSVFSITLLSTLCEPLVDTTYPPGDVAYYLNLNPVDSPLIRQLVAIYQLNEDEFLTNIHTLIYVKPKIFLTWNNFRFDFQFGLFNLLTGKIEDDKRLLSQSWKLWVFQTLKLVLESPQSSLIISKFQIVNSMYGQKFSNIRPLLLTRIYVNLILMMLSLISLAAEFRNFSHFSFTSWLMLIVVTTVGLLVRIILLALFVVFHYHAPFDMFILQLILAILNIIALLIVLVDASIHQDFPVKTDLSLFKTLTFSSLSGMELVPSPFDSTAPPTVDVIKSLSSNEERVHYYGRIHPPNPNQSRFTEDTTNTLSASTDVKAEVNCAEVSTEVARNEKSEEVAIEVVDTVDNIDRVVSENGADSVKVPSVKVYLETHYEPDDVPIETGIIKPEVSQSPRVMNHQSSTLHVPESAKSYISTIND